MDMNKEELKLITEALNAIHSALRAIFVCKPERLPGDLEDLRDSIIKLIDMGRD